jgi:hypothetical protein
MNDPSKPELTLAQCREIMRSEDAPTMHTMNTNQTEENNWPQSIPRRFMEFHETKEEETVSHS